MTERPSTQSYAAISGVYAALLGGLALGARRAGPLAEPIPPADLGLLAAATFTVAKGLTHERIGSWARSPFTEQEPDGTERPVGDGLRRAVGELVTCSRCVGTWSALGLVGVRLASPRAGRIVTTVLATAAANDFLQAGFRLVCSNANANAISSRAEPQPSR